MGKARLSTRGADAARGIASTRENGPLGAFDIVVLIGECLYLPGTSDASAEGATVPSRDTASAARIADLERKVRSGEATVADERARRLAAEQEAAALRRRVDEIATLLSAPLDREKEGPAPDAKPPAEEVPVAPAKVRKAEPSASSPPSDISGYAELLGKVLAAHHTTPDAAFARPSRPPVASLQRISARHR